MSMAKKVIDAIGWRLWISGNGTIHIDDGQTTEPVLFDSVSNDIMELEVTDEYDWYSCPNVFRAISDDLTAIARDDDPASSLSTVRRGREIWAEETSVALGSDESLAAYAYRRLKELQSPARTISYKRRFDPNVLVGSIIRISHSEIGIEGSFKVTSQSLELTYGCRTTEDAVLISE